MKLPPLYYPKGMKEEDNVDELNPNMNINLF